MRETGHIIEPFVFLIMRSVGHQAEEHQHHQIKYALFVVLCSLWPACPQQLDGSAGLEPHQKISQLTQ